MKKNNKEKKTYKKRRSKEKEHFHPYLALRQSIIHWFSNIRLSLTFRISLHYSFEILKTTISYLVLVSLIYFGAQMPGLLGTVERIGELTPDNGSAYTDVQILEQGVTAEIIDEAMPSDTASRFIAQCRAAFTRDLLLPNSVLHIRAPYRENQTLVVSFNLTSRLQIYQCLLIGFLLCDLFRIVGLLSKRNHLNKTVLKPIQDMTALAATLSANNLSNRINIAGTKNELKDLAIVINGMLDRIELSYNSQKQFVSDASHELRTPIAVIQGYVSMLNRWGKEDKSVLDESIAAIAQETESMKDLVESLLFLARHDKKTLLLEIETFDPCEIMAAIQREESLVAPSYTFRFDPMESSIIEADKHMVKQVMRILCDNAVKYTPEHGTIILGAKKMPNGCLLSVTDNGPGIPKEELSRIFDRFYRLDSARKKQSSGHGLGLSIAKIIVIAHQGKITVKSKVGVGTTFMIYLPSHHNLGKSVNQA